MYWGGKPTDENSVCKIRDHSFFAVITRSRKHMHSSISGTGECKRRNHNINNLIAIWDKDEDNASYAIVGIITIIIIIITHQIKSSPKYKKNGFRPRAKFSAF